MKDHFPIQLLETNSALPDSEVVLNRFRQLVIDGPADSPTAPTTEVELSPSLDDSDPVAPDDPTPMWDDDMEMDSAQDTIDLEEHEQEPDTATDESADADADSSSESVSEDVAEEDEPIDAETEDAEEPDSGESVEDDEDASLEQEEADALDDDSPEVFEDDDETVE